MANMQRLKQLYATIIPADGPGHPLAIFMLAVEAGALNFVQKHPDFEVAKARNGRCLCRECKPVLAHAISKRYLSHKFNDEPSEGIFSCTEMTRLLLSSGFEGVDHLEYICGLWTTFGSGWINLDGWMTPSSVDSKMVPGGGYCYRVNPPLPKPGQSKLRRCGIGYIGS